MTRAYSKALWLLAVLPLAACYQSRGMTPGQVSMMMTKGWMKHPANQFFYNFGPASGETKLANGDRVYRWTSLDARSTDYYGRDLVAHDYPGEGRYAGQNIRDEWNYSPRPLTTVTTYSTPNTEYVVVEKTDAVPATDYCELKILADRENTIWRIDVIVDSVGKWSASRCREILL